MPNCYQCQQHVHEGHLLKQVCSGGHTITLFVCFDCAALPKWQALISRIKQLPSLQQAVGGERP